MCTAEAVTREHVPPLCIFPEPKDLPPGMDYRKNLIKVPSCKEHNLRKSGDDEYLLYLLVTNWDVNNPGLRQWKTKVKRSLIYQPSKRGIFKNLTPVSIGGINTGFYNVDIDRINSEIEKVSLGIYFYHFQKQWFHPVEVVNPVAKLIDTPEAAYNNRIIQETSNLIMSYLEAEPIHGENPEIFRYQYKIDEEIQTYILKMVFYGGINISTISKPPESEP